jgi:hypothetical protein
MIDSWREAYCSQECSSASREKTIEKVQKLQNDFSSQAERIYSNFLRLI